MKTVQLNLYAFRELDEKAKEKALTAWHDLNLFDDWWDYTYDDFITICGLLGITADKKSIHFEGFYSQGDGSSFNAEVDFTILLKGVQSRAWRGYAPKLDFEFGWPGIDKRVLALVERGKIDMNARIISRTRGYGVVVDLGVYPAFHPVKNYDLIYAELDELEKWLNGVAQILNRFLFKQLQDNYDYLISDEAIAETIEANEYAFTADGMKAERLEKLATNNDFKN
jgi:hypothetical protein